MKKLIYISILLAVVLTACKPERPDPPKGKPRIFYPEEPKRDTLIVSDSVVQADIEVEVRNRALLIFQNVLTLYNAHQYNSIDQKALVYCTENVKRKYKAVMAEWNNLPQEEKDEYIESPSLWWYFIGGNIDTRSGRRLQVRAEDIEIICADKELAVLRVTQEVSLMESTYCKVVLNNQEGRWLIADLIPEAIGGGGDNKSFMNDHW